MDNPERVKILLVDDQMDNLVALEAVLGELGQELVKVTSGREALRRMLDDDFAVVLLDVRMPIMDGFETASLIRTRERSQHTPIIFITAISKSETNVYEGYALGAVDYIFKPIVPEILRSKVAVFVDLFRKNVQVSRLNEKLRRRTVELEATNKALEAFSYSVSHDLRAPLRAINGFSEILARRHRQSLDAEGQRYVDNIFKAGVRMDELIEDLLLYARAGRQTSNTQTVQLRGVFSRILDSLAGNLREANAYVDIPESLPAIQGNRALVEQIFMNLIQNAITYRSPGLPPRISIGCQLDVGHCTIYVRDNGIGIAPENHGKIFNMFQRLHAQDKYPGTGIGLAIVHRSVGLMGGEVWVESTEGQGSTFHVKLPRAKS